MCWSIYCRTHFIWKKKRNPSGKHDRNRITLRQPSVPVHLIISPNFPRLQRVSFKLRICLLTAWSCFKIDVLKQVMCMSNTVWSWSIIELSKKIRNQEIREYNLNLSAGARPYLKAPIKIARIANKMHYSNSKIHRQKCTLNQLRCAQTK